MPATPDPSPLAPEEARPLRERQRRRRGRNLALLLALLALALVFYGLAMVKMAGTS